MAKPAAWAMPIELTARAAANIAFFMMYCLLIIRETVSRRYCSVNSRSGGTYGLDSLEPTRKTFAAQLRDFGNNPYLSADASNWIVITKYAKTHDAGAIKSPNPSLGA